MFLRASIPAVPGLRPEFLFIVAASGAALMVNSRLGPGGASWEAGGGGGHEKKTVTFGCHYSWRLLFLQQAGVFALG